MLHEVEGGALLQEEKAHNERFRPGEKALAAATGPGERYHHIWKVATC